MTNSIRTLSLSRVLLVAGMFALIAGCSAGSEPAIPKDANLQSWLDNGANGRYVLNVISGTLPAMSRSGMPAMVMTDSNCAPDANNFNHCRNIIKFANGDSIQVINNHRMSVHRCLRPGEIVHVHAMEGPWVALQTGS